MIVSMTWVAAPCGNKWENGRPNLNTVPLRVGAKNPGIWPRVDPRRAPALLSLARKSSRTVILRSARNHRIEMLSNTLLRAACACDKGGALIYAFL